MTSSIITSKTPDGHDMAIISGNVYVELGGQGFNPLFEYNSNLPQTGQNDDPGLVGFQYIEWTPDEWHHFEQRIAIGPKWFELDTNNLVPVVSPVSLHSMEISEQAILNQAGWAVETVKVDKVNNRIKLIVKLGLYHPWDGGPWAYLLRLSYNVAAVGYITQPQGGPFVPSKPRGPIVSSCSKSLKIANAWAIGTTELENPAKNACDYDPGNTTRWAAPATPDNPAWIKLDLGLISSVCRVDILWYQGDSRKYDFMIAVSLDDHDGTYNDVYGGLSGEIAGTEQYTFQNINAKYVRITVKGNTWNQWASIINLRVYGQS